MSLGGSVGIGRERGQVGVDTNYIGDQGGRAPGFLDDQLQRYRYDSDMSSRIADMLLGGAGFGSAGLPSLPGLPVQPLGTENRNWQSPNFAGGGTPQTYGGGATGVQAMPGGGMTASGAIASQNFGATRGLPTLMANSMSTPGTVTPRPSYPWEYNGNPGGGSMPWQGMTIDDEQMGGGGIGQADNELQPGGQGVPGGGGDGGPGASNQPMGGQAVPYGDNGPSYNSGSIGQSMPTGGAIGMLMDPSRWGLTQQEKDSQGVYDWFSSGNMTAPEDEMHQLLKWSAINPGDQLSDESAQGYRDLLNNPGMYDAAGSSILGAMQAGGIRDQDLYNRLGSYINTPGEDDSFRRSALHGLVSNGGYNDAEKSAMDQLIMGGINQSYTNAADEAKRMASARGQGMGAVTDALLMANRNRAADISDASAKNILAQREARIADLTAGLQGLQGLEGDVQRRQQFGLGQQGDLSDRMLNAQLSGAGALANLQNAIDTRKATGAAGLGNRSDELFNRKMGAVDRNLGLLGDLRNYQMAGAKGKSDLGAADWQRQAGQFQSVMSLIDMMNRRKTAADQGLSDLATKPRRQYTQTGETTGQGTVSGSM